MGTQIKPGKRLVNRDLFYHEVRLQTSDSAITIPQKEERKRLTFVMGNLISSRVCNGGGGGGGKLSINGLDRDEPMGKRPWKHAAYRPACGKRRRAKEEKIPP